MTSQIILDNLNAGEVSELVARAAANAVKNGNLVELLRSPYGHYGSITQTAADYIEALHSKINALESSAPETVQP